MHTHIIQGNLGLLPGIGGKPQEQSIQAANTKLQRRDGKREATSSAHGLERELVGDVVVVVAKVPQAKVGEEGDVNSKRRGGGSSSTCRLDDDCGIVVGRGGGCRSRMEGRGGGRIGTGKGRRRLVVADAARGGDGMTARAESKG